MHKYIFTLLLIIPVYALQAQTVPNGTLEAWVTSASNLYEEPGGNYWATLNPLADLTGPVTVEKTTDACEGTYAAKLTTKNFSALLVSGLLASGTFNPSNFQNPLLFGQPFTLRPQSFSGCFKYSPVAGDSCALVAWVSKWNTQTNQRDTVGVAAWVIDTAVNAYTTYTIPFDYTSAETPDTLTIVFSSSADGQNNNGQIGSAMWVDNVNINLTNGVALPMMPEVAVKCYPNPFTSYVMVELHELSGKSTFTLYSAEGKILEEQPIQQGINKVDISLPAGMYYYTVSSHNSVISWGTLAGR